MAPQRRKTGPVGPSRRRPKVAGASRAKPEAVKPEQPNIVPKPEDHRPPAGAPPQREAERPVPDPVDLSKREPQESEPEAEELGDSGGGSAGRRWRPVAVLGAAALVLAAFASVAAFRPGVSTANEAWVDHAATAQVTEAATHAIETMHGYNFETIDDDFARIRELLTPERREEFDSTASVTKEAAVQTRTVTEVDVAHIGASMLDESTAEVAAFINVSATGDGIAQGSAAAPLLLRMEKSDGRWLVSDIRDR
ncbi:hypothetical protein [Rhodococcus chondri]|uniref:Mce-associated membrane protein n=1 Tax=Rhodococcus chondri TaxID=3065941 RepID=A0ABU7JPG9_9NOCA|nr:hypothetical protein [Rhodococcus sp. CC-R104]MEE2031920.1 hypothetical protein [Rhodococcus sp. CC-R104]